jgi:hypothetical protein
MAPILLVPRQSSSNNDDVILPTTYSGFSSSPDPGVVAGIVLGSVGGFLLILALLYSCLGWAPIAFSGRRTAAGPDDELSVRSRSVLSFRTRTTSQHKHHHSHKHRRPVRATEMYEVRTSERTTSQSRPRAAQPPTRSGSVRVETVHPPPRVVRDESSTSDDEVVVIEERTPPRRKSHRHSGGSRRADERRGSNSRRYSRDY